MELFNSTIDLKTYPEPYPFTNDFNIFDEISDGINLISYNEFIESRPKDVIKLNIQRYVYKPIIDDKIDVSSLKISYSI